TSGGHSWSFFCTLPSCHRKASSDVPSLIHRAATIIACASSGQERENAPTTPRGCLITVLCHVTRAPLHPLLSLPESSASLLPLQHS
ncbi:hypothetical protein PMAYCL1PPCAC_22010, partial [Pristionchus mayeri]